MMTVFPVHFFVVNPSSPGHPLRANVKKDALIVTGNHNIKEIFVFWNRLLHNFKALNPAYSLYQTSCQ